MSRLLSLPVIIIFLTLDTYDPEGDEKLRIYKLGYDQQSVQSVSCRRTAL